MKQLLLIATILLPVLSQAEHHNSTEIAEQCINDGFDSYEYNDNVVMINNVEYYTAELRGLYSRRSRDDAASFSSN